jgi:hypothetical protein
VFSINTKTMSTMSNSELRAEVSANCFRRFLRSDRAVMSVTAQSLRRSGAFSADLSLKYNIDFRIYGFESGFKFNQDIEIIKGVIIKNKTIKFDNYNWECICPDKGG